jgi:hypothetical protein
MKKHSCDFFLLDDNFFQQLSYFSIPKRVDNDFITIANGFNCEITTIKRSTFNIENMKAVGKTVDKSRASFYIIPICLELIQILLKKSLFNLNTLAQKQLTTYIYGQL